MAVPEPERADAYEATFQDVTIEDVVKQDKERREEELELERVETQTRAAFNTIRKLAAVLAAEAGYECEIWDKFKGGDLEEAKEIENEISLAARYAIDDVTIILQDISTRKAHEVGEMIAGAKDPAFKIEEA